MAECNEQPLPIEQMQEAHESEQIFFRLVQKIGATGKYQFSLFITLSAISLYTGAVVLVTPFLFFQDYYLCNSLSSKACLQHVCSLAPAERVAFVPAQNSIESFANRFGDFRCPAERAQLNLTITILYSGPLLAFFLTFMMGNMLRSKVIMLGGLVIALAGVLLLSLSHVYWLGVLGMFLLSTGISISYNLTYIFITELVEERKRQKYKIVIASIFSIGGLCDVLWFFLIPNFEVVMLVFFGVPLLLIAIVFIVFFRDTPISLITKHSAEAAFERFIYIARFNGNQSCGLTLQEVRQTQDKYRRQCQSKDSSKAKKFTVLDLFRYKSLRKMTLILIVVDCVFYLQYLAPTLMLNQFHFNIFLNGSAIQSAQVFAAIFGYLTIMKIPRRTSGCVSFGIIMVCSFILIFVWDQDETEVAHVGQSISVLVFLFFIELTVSNAFNNYAVYLNELYPTQIRIVGIAFIKMFGAITTMVSSQIIHACISSGFKIMILFAILAGLSILLYYLLPETHGKRPPEVIQELASSRQQKELRSAKDYQDMVEQKQEK